MRVPAALQQWAAEHSDQLSQDTVGEVQAIATTLASSSLSERPIDALGDDFAERLATIFPDSRAQRAETLIDVVATWAAKRVPVDPNDSTVEPVYATAAPPDTVMPATPRSRHDQYSDLAPSTVPGAAIESSLPEADDLSAIGTAPAFLRSDKVDEEDDVRLYGPRSPWKAVLGTLAGLVLVAALVSIPVYFFTRGSDEESATTAPTTSAVDETETATPSEPTAPVDPTAVPTVAPTPVPEPTAVVASFWADVTPILNSGTAEIIASTYAVSPSNRAVLTGHTAGITGIAISNDGRVLTSGADRRLVDWGADVTLANPDVLNVPSPLTVLERTEDQRIVAGDAAGSITVIDLVDSVEPIVQTVHDAAISAVAELSDGRFAVASADGPVAVFALDTPDDQIVLPHDVEVTAIHGSAEPGVVTASADGVIRFWDLDNIESPAIIDSLPSPATALTALSDGQLAYASVTGQIRIGGGAEPFDLPGHVGAVRALREIVLPDGSMALASGGDDTTVRLWDVSTRTQLRVLEGHGDIISGLDALPDGRLVSTSGDGTGRVWDLTVEGARPVIPTHDWNLSALHPWNNDQFVSGGVDGKVMLASTSETTEPRLITQHEAPIVGLSVLANSDIVSLDSASVLRVSQSTGDAASMVEIGIAPGSTALDVRDSLGIVSGHADGSVRFHDFGEEVSAVQAHEDGVNHVISLSTGLVASAGQDRTVRIIDFETGQVTGVFDLHTSPVDVVIELPDGRLASAGDDGIYIFTVDGLADGHVRLNGQRSRIVSLAALPGDRLISTGDDGRVRVWDLATPEAEPSTLVDIPGVINPHLIQADNGLFVAGAARGYVVFTVG